MRIMNCPRCKNPVPNTTIECPHCGYDIQDHLAEREMRKCEQENKRTQAKMEDLKREAKALDATYRKDTAQERREIASKAVLQEISNIKKFVCLLS